MNSQAKFRTPGFQGILPRPRLFRSLTRQAEAAVTWITGPPGGGKSSLAIGFLHQASAPHLWYQVDAGDADPALMFLNLRQAVQRASRKLNPVLPVFGPEYAPGLSVFSRRFFEALFSRLPKGAVLVLDDYQEIPLQSPTHEVLREGFSVLPPDARVFVLSRQLPPAPYARLRANGHVRVMEWEELRMDPEEARGLLRNHLPKDASPQEVAEIADLADGWPAGLVLLAKGQPGKRTPLEAANRELLFDYFASEVITHMEPAVRDVMLKTAFLPRCNRGQAASITGVPEAAALLHSLAGSGCFMAKHGRKDPVCEFHPLFREFLLDQAAVSFPQVELDQLREQAAELLEADGDLHGAFELLHSLGNQDLQIGMILDHMHALLVQGQYRTLNTWLDALPPDVIAGNGALSFALGLCRMPVDLLESRGHLERAFRLFEAGSDLEGQMRVWAPLVDTHLFAWDDFSALDPWISWLDKHAPEFAAMQDAFLVEPVSVSMVWALVHRCPDHPDIAQWIQRAEAILRDASDLRLRVRAGAAAIAYHFWAGHRTTWEMLAQRIQRSLQNQDDPLVTLTHHWVDAGVHSWMRTPLPRSREAVEVGLAAGDRYGIHMFDFMFHGLSAAWAIGEKDPEKARSALAAMERTAQGYSSWSYLHYLLAWKAVLDGDLAQAAVYGEQSMMEAVASGMPSSEALTRLAWANLLFEQGRLEELEAQTPVIAALVERLDSPAITALYHLGMVRRNSGDHAALQNYLRQGLAIAKQHGLVNFQWMVPAWMARMCESALEYDIEPEFARRLIMLHDLQPGRSRLYSPVWPRKLRITTLGSFSIQREGEVLRFPPKAPRRVLLLLKAIVAGGRGGIGEDLLADQIWPEADGDAAAQALATALHRLRKLLCVDGAILMREGRLRLDPSRCWVDAHAFEALPESGRTAPSRSEIKEALALYQGPFLADLEETWAQRYRYQLQERHKHLLASLR